MAVTQSALDNISTNYNLKFRTGLQDLVNVPNFTVFADETTSSDAEEIYPIRAESAGMREWLGERQIHTTQVYGYKLANKVWEGSVSVKVDDVDRDKYRLYDSQFVSLGQAGARLPFDQVVAALKAGGTNLCYDGQAFFSDSHPLDPMGTISGTSDNLFASTALTAANLEAVLTAMATRQTRYGQLFGVTPSHLVVPRALRKTAREILEGELITQTMTSPGNLAVASSNVMRGTLDLVVLPELDADSATTWYVMDLTKPVKPFFWQWEKRPTLTAVTRADSEEVYRNRRYLYLADAKGAAGYGLWQLAAKCTA